MEPKLIKIDRNGSKHFEGLVPCDRCGGTGTYVWGAIINGCPQYAGTCFKCGGEGKVWSKWIERTPEYQAKLDAKRDAKHKAQAEKYESERKEREAKAEAERLEREAKIKAEKAISQYVGNVGDRLKMTATYVGTGSYKVDAFSGFGKETIYIHIFKDDHGNKLTWKTATNIGWWEGEAWDSTWHSYEAGDAVALRGTVKDHTEYKDEKQTVLTRCKVERS